jgi:hypothetical protein
VRCHAARVTMELYLALQEQHFIWPIRLANPAFSAWFQVRSTCIISPPQVPDSLPYTKLSECSMNANKSEPTPYYTLFQTSKGTSPAVVVVNSSLRRFAEREKYAWHLAISINCRLLAENGMPTSEESDVLRRIEDTIEAAILDHGNGVFLARITCKGERELKYRVNDPELANGELSRLVKDNVERVWSYFISEDSDWRLAQPELSLFEKSPGHN